MVALTDSSMTWLVLVALLLGGCGATRVFFDELNAAYNGDGNSSEAEAVASAQSAALQPPEGMPTAAGRRECPSDSQVLRDYRTGSQLVPAEAWLRHQRQVAATEHHTPERRGRPTAT